MKPGERRTYELVEPTKNARRWYALACEARASRARQLGLFDRPFELVIAFGRMGPKGGAPRKPHVLRERFASLEALGKRARTLEATRERHGYQRRA